MRPSSAGRMRRRARARPSPPSRSSPASRTFCPVFWPGGEGDRLAARRARSCITTVSAPSGTTPPVMMRTHWPGATRPGERAGPRRTRRPPSSVVSPSASRSAPRIAQPSMAELRCDGHVHRREDVLGEHAAQSAERTGTRSVAAHRLEEAVDELARLRHRHRVRVVVVGAGRLGDGERGHGQRALSGRSFKRSILPSGATESRVTSRITPLNSPRSSRFGLGERRLERAGSGWRAMVMCGS